MKKQGKVWGTTAELYRDKQVSVHVLEVKAGGFCSEHKHARRTNAFHVLSGLVAIEIWSPDGLGPPDVTVLSAGQSTAIPINVFHRFRGIEDSHVVEICEQALPDEDIERRVPGGVLDTATHEFVTTTLKRNKNSSEAGLP